MPSYLEEMIVRTAAAVASLPEVRRERHTAYLRSEQRSDGGFAGREGDSDLYYTGFGLRGLFVLGQLHGASAERAAEFLRSRWHERHSVVDFLSLIYGAVMLKTSAGIDVLRDVQPDWPSEVSRFLEQLRRDDGGYAKASTGRASSTYHSFLVLMCQQMIECPTPAPDRLVKFIRSRQDHEGGFQEIRVSKRASTNPTAAAIGVLRMLRALDDQTRQSTSAFLARMQSEEGGFRANTRIPMADLLSTCTAVLTLMDLGGMNLIDQRAALRYVEALEHPGGGFRGAVWDDTVDVEYTFYGLSSLAALNAVASE